MNCFGYSCGKACARRRTITSKSAEAAAGADATFEDANGLKIYRDIAVAAVESVITADASRHNDVSFVGKEAPVHDAQERHGFAIESKRGSHDRRVAIKLRSPQLVAHDENRRGARLIVLCGEGAAQVNLRAKNIKPVVGDLVSVEYLGAFLVGVEYVQGPVAGNLFKHMILVPQIHEFGDREQITAVLGGPVDIVNENNGGAVLVLVRIRFQQDAVGHAEDDGCGTNSECESEDS